MTMLMAPIRIGGFLLALALGAGVCMALAIAVTRGHLVDGSALVAPLLSLVVGLVAGIGFWRSSRTRFAIAIGALVVLAIVFGLVVVVAGAAQGR